MSQDYIAIAQRLRAQAERRTAIRRRKMIVLGLFVVFTILIALVG